MVLRLPVGHIKPKMGKSAQHAPLNKYYKDTNTDYLFHTYPDYNILIYLPVIMTIYSQRVCEYEYHNNTAGGVYQIRRRCRNEQACTVRSHHPVGSGECRGAGGDGSGDNNGNSNNNNGNGNDNGNGGGNDQGNNQICTFCEHPVIRNQCAGTKVYCQIILH